MRKTPLFSAGEISLSEDIADIFTPEEIEALLIRHMNGDFGEIDKELFQKNIQATIHGGEIESRYMLNDSTWVWLITSSDYMGNDSTRIVFCHSLG